MGGSSSTPQTQDAASVAAPTGLQKPAVTNNGGDVVVIPVDHSKQAENAFLWYVNHAHKPEDEVRIVHIQENLPASPIKTENMFYIYMAEEAKKDGLNLLKRYEQMLAVNNVKGTVKLMTGKRGDMVVTTAEKERASRIVMGTRGVGVGIIRRTVAGSVSEYVIHHTRIPVTVVPTEPPGWFM